MRARISVHEAQATTFGRLNEQRGLEPTNGPSQKVESVGDMNDTRLFLREAKAARTEEAPENG